MQAAAVFIGCESRERDGVPAPELDPTTSTPTESPCRDNGFVALRSYAPIGDGRTIALVAEDGAIDWFPVPALDSVPVFAAAVDSSNGGRLELAPSIPFSSQRRYLPHSNVLETTFSTESGRVRVIEALNLWAQWTASLDGVGAPGRGCGRRSADALAGGTGLGRGPLLYRFSGAQAEQEGTFVACSFWTVSPLHYVGRDAEARKLMAELIELTNDVGVLSEMIDPDDNSFLGNLPQGLSHLALVGAALDLQS